MKLEELRPFTQDQSQSSSLRNISDSKLQEILSFSELMKLEGGIMYGLGIGFLISSGMAGLDTSEAIPFVSAAACLIYSGKKYYENGSKILKKSMNLATARGLIVSKRLIRRKLTEISEVNLEPYLLPKLEW